jgi:enterochelin esterase-like enzyme
MFLLASLFMLVPLLQAQHGRVFDNLSMESEILGMERRYAVYLPPDYETSERSYPVLYLLHGSGNRCPRYFPLYRTTSTSIDPLHV